MLVPLFLHSLQKISWSIQLDSNPCSWIQAVIASLAWFMRNFYDLQLFFSSKLLPSSLKKNKIIKREYIFLLNNDYMQLFYIYTVSWQWMPKYSYVWKDQVPICVELLGKPLKSYQAIDSCVTTAIQCHAINQSKICALGSQQAPSLTFQAAAAAGWAGAKVPHLLLLSQNSTRSTISKGVPNSKGPRSFLHISSCIFSILHFWCHCE